MKPGRAVAIAAALTAASCATEPPRRPAPPAPVILTPAPEPVMSARAYVSASASFDLFVIRAAQIAAVRARDPGVRAQARAELADHRGLSAQLSFAGRRLDLLPPAAMGMGDARDFALLEASTDFDAAYKKQLIAKHYHQLRISRDVAARSSSPTLRPVARNAAAVIAGHLDRLGAL